MNNDAAEFVGAGVVVAYVVGVPISFGYMLAAMGSANAPLILFGAFFWPVVALAKIGWWLAGVPS